VRTKEPEALRNAIRERILIPAVQVAGVRIAVAVDP